MDMRQYTEEEVELARNVDLVDLLTSMGYTVRRVGHYYTTKEIDSLRIYNRTGFCRHSDNTGGTAINMLQMLCDLSFQEAMQRALEFVGYPHPEGTFYQQQIDNRKRTDWINDYKNQIHLKQEAEPAPEQREFTLPNRSVDYRRMYGYLIHQRGLAKETIDYFVNKKVLYESAKYHNVVFVGRDKDGVARYGGMRGTNSYGKAFKGDVTGSSKEYGFSIINPSCDRLIVTEAAIDLMSYTELMHDHDSNLLSLAGTADCALLQLLREHPHIHEVWIGTDNDEPGRKASQHIKDVLASPEWRDQVQTVCNLELLPAGIKDFNDYILAGKTLAALSLCPQQLQLPALAARLMFSEAATEKAIQLALDAGLITQSHTLTESGKRELRKLQNIGFLAPEQPAKSPSRQLN